MKKISLIGAGYWGKNHLRVLKELDLLHSVVEPSEEIRRERQKDFPEVIFFSEGSKVVADKKISAVVIAAPAKLHYQLAKKYLLAGKDVFVEKPLSLSAKEGEELVNIAKDNDRILMVGHILHYHPAVKKIKELLKNGEIGELRYIYSNRLNMGKFRIEENVLWSFAPHDISLILSLVEAEVTNIDSFGSSFITPGIYDTTLTILNFQNGTRAHIFVSWLHPFKEQKLVVVGSEKMLVFEDTSEEKLKLYKHKIKYNGNIPIAEKVPYEVVSFEDEEPLKNEIWEFVKSMENRTNPLTDGEEGLRTLKVLEKCEMILRSKE